MSDEELVVWSAPTEGAATQWDGVLTSPHPIAQAVRFLADRTARASARGTWKADAPHGSRSNSVARRPRGRARSIFPQLKWTSEPSKTKRFAVSHLTGGEEYI
jgi:hypothetical protein